MGLVLLWTENLVLALLLVAFLWRLLAWSGLPGWARMALRGLVPGLPLLFYAAFGIALAGVTLVYPDRMRWPFGLSFALNSLVVCYLVGVVLLFRRGLRPGETQARQWDEWPLGRLAAVLFFVGALHLVTLWNLDTAARERLAILDSEARQLIFWNAPQRPKPNENAATYYLRVFPQFEAEVLQQIWPKKWTEKWEWGWTDADSKLDADDPDLKEFLRYNAGTLEQLHRAAKCPEFFFERDHTRSSLTWSFPELQSLRQGARLLSVAARAESGQGNYPQAIEHLNAMYRMARHADQEAFFVSQIVAIAMHNVANETFESIAATAPPTVDWSSLDAVDNYRPFRSAVTRALLMEESAGLTFFTQLASGEFSPDPTMSPTRWPALYRIFIFPADVAQYRSELQQNREVAENEPFGKALKMLQRDPQREAFPLSALLLPATSEYFKAIHLGDARQELALLARDFLNYRHEHGKYPESIEAWSLETGSLLPIDPYTGTLLKLARTGNSLVLYSVGHNLADDGGRSSEDFEGRENGDEVFRLPL